MKPGRIKVLVVDDSAVARQVMVHLLDSDPAIQVVGALPDGQAAVDFVNISRPDAVVMDLHMPNVDGLEATRRIMETQPTPIIICSATADTKAVATTFRLLDAGAIACVEKPVSTAHPDFGPLAANLLQTVKLMSEVKVIRRWPRSRGFQSRVTAGNAAALQGRDGVRVIGIGASTGGPPVLCQILRALPKDFPIPILIVQHIARGFLGGLVDWLNQNTELCVQIAANGIAPLPGHAYLAPDEFHMGLAPARRIVLSGGDPENGLRPAVSFLFRSLAETCGPGAAGVLLTGMGRDGGIELKLMRDRGAVTIAQNRESSVVHGMPGAAIELGAASLILSPEKIADALAGLAIRKSINAANNP